MRCVLEIAVPVWHPGLTITQTKDIERVQVAALHAILRKHFKGYRNALVTCNLGTLKQRREELCRRFAVRAANHEKHSKWFVPNKKETITREKTLQEKKHYKRKAHYYNRKSSDNVTM